MAAIAAAPRRHGDASMQSVWGLRVTTVSPLANNDGHSSLLPLRLTVILFAFIQGCGGSHMLHDACEAVEACGELWRLGDNV